MQETKTAVKNQVGEYELLDHGIDHAQYFQGCGVAFTNFDNVVTGCGDNFAEALDDALDSIAQDGFDSESLLNRMMHNELSAYDKGFLPTTPSASEEFRKSIDLNDHEHFDDCELYYYVSIRWNA